MKYIEPIPIQQFDHDTVFQAMKLICKDCHGRGNCGMCQLYQFAKILNLSVRKNKPITEAYKQTKAEIKTRINHRYIDRVYTEPKGVVIR
jgi:hypothetical protein